ncbi:MAG TPA: TolC family protein [Candidatus Kryptonia bacterium]
MSVHNFKLSILNIDFVFAIVFAVGASAVAQTQLDSLIGIAIGNNLEIRTARYESSAAEVKVSPAMTLPDPELSVMADNVPSNFKLNSDQMTMFPQFKIMQMIPWFGKLAAAGDAQRYGFDAESDRVSTVTLGVVSELRKTYADIYTFQKSIQYLKYKETLLESVVQVSERLFAVGQVPEQDVFRTSAELTMVRSDLITMNSMLSGDFARLGAILGVDSSYQIQVDTLELTPLPASESFVTLLKSNNPELSMIRNAEASSKANVEYAKRDAVPDFSFGFSYGYRGALMPDGTKALNMMNFEVGVSIPIFYGSRQRKLIDEAEFMSKAQESRYNLAEVDLLSQIRSAYANADARTKLIPLYEKELIPQYDATFNSSLSSYSVGKTSFAMVIDNLTNLINAKIELAKIEAAYFSALADMSKLVGEGSEKYRGVK